MMNELRIKLQLLMGQAREEATMRLEKLRLDPPAMGAIEMSIDETGTWSLIMRVSPDDKRQRIDDVIPGYGETPEEAYEAWYTKLLAHVLFVEHERNRRRRNR